MLIKTRVPIVTLMRVDVAFWRRGYGKKLKRPWLHYRRFQLSTYMQGELSQGWRKYMSRFENLLLAMNITNAIRKKAMLLHYVGEEVNEIFDTLDVPEATEEEDVFRKAEKALREYSTPQKNIEFEVYKFRQAKQLSREISAYHTKLKQLAKSCDFYDEKRKIKTQIIQNGISSKLRRKALADPGITLEKILQIAKAMELSIRSSSRGHPKCRFCGYQHVPGKKNCPAYGKQCRTCHKFNHFRACCKDKREESKRNENWREKSTPSKRN